MHDTDTKLVNDRKAAIERALAMDSGSLDRIRHWTGRIIYTPGVAEMAELCGGHWLVDLVASHQITASVRAEEFQVWTLTATANKTATITADDGNSRVIATQQIEFTDFPLDEMKLYLDSGTLMLPGEY